MGVVFDNTANVEGTAVTSLTTASFRITSYAERAGVLTLLGQSVTGVTGSIGGVAGTQVAGAHESGTGHYMFGVIAPPSGDQTGTMSWTPASNSTLGVVTAFGVRQSNSFVNGTFVPGTNPGSHQRITIQADGFSNSHCWTGSPFSEMIGCCMAGVGSGWLTVAGCEPLGTVVTTVSQDQRWNTTGGQKRAGSTGVFPPVTYRCTSQV